MRLLVASLVGSVALVAPGGGSSATDAVDARTCTQRGSFFNVQILGDRDAEYHFNFARGHFGLPDGRTVVTVWSLGGPTATAGIAMYGWIASGQSRLATYCATARPRQRDPKPAGLRAPVRIKDGWGSGPRYACLQSGRVAVQARDIAGGKRLVVRIQQTGALIAVAEVKRGGGWLRASKRCEQRS